METTTRAPRCYCSAAQVCDFCNGYRHPLVRGLDCPREMRALAEMLGCETKVLARMSEAGIEALAAKAVA